MTSPSDILPPQDKTSFYSRTLSRLRRLAVQWLGPGVLIFIAIWSTRSQYGITWDEPVYQDATWYARIWLSLPLKQMLSKVEIERHWQVDPTRNVHPAGLKWLYLAAERFILWEKNPYQQNRLLSLVLFVIALLAFMRWLAGVDRFVGYAAGFFLMTLSRFFAHVHFAATDIPMVALFLLFIVIFERCFFRKTFPLAGVVLGFAIAIKLTSAILAFPVMVLFLLWHRQRWREVLLRMTLLMVTAAAVFYILNPDWWLAPIARGVDFFRQSFTRQEWASFSCYFWGKIYTFRGPFYYPFVIFGITTPLFHLFFLLLGAVAYTRSRAWRTHFKMAVCLVGLAFPFFLLALPFSPATDVERYLLPAFPFAAVFMALGGKQVLSWISGWKRSAWWERAGSVAGLTALSLLGGWMGWQAARYHPYELSYYNELIGGAAGAWRTGFETTYWWDALNDDNLGVLNSLCRGSAVYFPISPTSKYFKHMRALGVVQFLPTDLPQARYMLIMGRPTVDFWERKTLPDLDRLGLERTMAWEKTIDSVPILRLYALHPAIRNPPILP